MSLRREPSKEPPEAIRKHQPAPRSDQPRLPPGDVEDQSEDRSRVAEQPHDAGGDQISVQIGVPANNAGVRCEGLAVVWVWDALGIATDNTRDM